MQHDQQALNSAEPFTIKPGTYEYLLVAYPDTEMGSRMMEEEQSFSNRYQGLKAAGSKPYITIANFFADEDMEDTFSRWIQRICGQQKSFQVVLNNYSGLPPHAVFVRVQNPAPFQALAKHLQVVDSYVRSYGFPAVKMVGNPHLSIARSLPEDVYSKAIFDYAHREFYGSFIVRELVLLRRKQQSNPGDKVNVFRLLPDLLPVSFNTQLPVY